MNEYRGGFIMGCIVCVLLAALVLNAIGVLQ